MRWGAWPATMVRPVPFSFFVATEVYERRDPLAGLVVDRELAFLDELQESTLVSALDCEAMRNSVSMVILRPASLSAQPTARWYTGLPSRSTSATMPATRPSLT